MNPQPDTLYDRAWHALTGRREPWGGCAERETVDRIVALVLAETATAQPEASPSVTIVAWGATPEQAERLFDAAVDTAHDHAAPGVTVDAVATLRPGATLDHAQPEADTVERAARALDPGAFDPKSWCSPHFGQTPEAARSERQEYARDQARAALAAAQPEADAVAAWLTVRARAAETPGGAA